MDTIETEERFRRALWRLYNRPARPVPWESGGNLPWNDPDFSRRMLREHLDQSHGAASRTDGERAVQIDWLWGQLDLQEDARVLDITCGPGLYAVELARRGCRVTGIDFGPASIEHARGLAQAQGVAQRCHFIENDVRKETFPTEQFDAALFLYGQLAVFTVEEARRLLNSAAAALVPGGKLCIELLNAERVDRKNSTWWYTSDRGLWGDAPHICLGERMWYAEEGLSLERFYVLHLETGRLDEVTLVDQTYTIPAMTSMLHEAGFAHVDVFPDWAGLPLNDAREWVVFIAEK